MRTVLLTVTLLLVLAVPARADVLVNAPKSAIRCGQAIRLGVWYRDFPTTGHREATVEVRSVHGFVLFHRHLQAPPQWKYWRYYAHCGRHYSVRYRTFAGVSTFHVRVKRGG
jgi:hypothetical protein